MKSQRQRIRESNRKVREREEKTSEREEREKEAVGTDHLIVAETVGESDFASPACPQHLPHLPTAD
jgi:hypothetical protein